MELEDLKRIVADVAAKEPSVLAAWIFGSRVRGEERPSSDLDVALLTASEGRPPAIEDRVGGGIAAECGLDVDVSRLDLAGPALAFEVVTEGCRVYARDDLAADLAEERARRVYLDTEHLRRVQNHYLYGDPL